MTDSHIIDIIAAHRPYGLDCKCGEPINSDKAWALHFAAALRGKYAIIQLPDGIRHGNNYNWSFYDVSASAGSGVVRITRDDHRHTPDAARKLAAEILAAADKAEKQ